MVMDLSDVQTAHINKQTVVYVVRFLLAGFFLPVSVLFFAAHLARVNAPFKYARSLYANIFDLGVLLLND